MTDLFKYQVKVKIWDVWNHRPCSLSLGTWAFGGDIWWGKQEDKNSVQVMETALKRGVTLIDTAPVYGRGRSEIVIGCFIKKRNLRDKVIIATKLGLRWEGAKIFHDLSKKRMLEEIDDSRRRLQTDYFDLYQVHWPDPSVPIAQTASVMNDFYEKGIIKSIGVSNYSVSQMEEFMKHAPLHSLQPEYSMFNRDIEKDILPFCVKNNIAVLSYAPLYSGILTGKFFFDDVEIPQDRNRLFKKKHFEEPLYSVNKDTLLKLKKIADKYGKSLTHVALNWNFSREGITSAIAGMRNEKQALDNLKAVGWKINEEDDKEIEKILNNREARIKELK